MEAEMLHDVGHPLTDVGMTTRCAAEASVISVFKKWNQYRANQYLLVAHWLYVQGDCAVVLWEGLYFIVVVVLIKKLRRKEIGRVSDKRHKTPKMI